MIDRGRLHWDLAAGNGFADRLLNDEGFEVGSVHPYHSSRVSDGFADAYVAVTEIWGIEARRDYAFLENREDGRACVEAIYHSRGYAIADWHTVGQYKFGNKGSKEKGTN